MDIWLMVAAVAAALAIFAAWLVRDRIKATFRLRIDGGKPPSLDLEQQLLRGRQAAELLEHPLLVEAFDMLQGEVVEAWKSSPARDEEGREKLWMMLHLSEKVKNYLRTHIETGKMAEISLKGLQKKSVMERVGLI